MTKFDPNAMPRPEEENKRAVNILISIPAYGGVVQADCMLSILHLNQLLSIRDIDHWISVITNESLVTRVRNEFANTAAFDSDPQGQPFSHLLFIDADSVFNAEDILKMIEADKPIIALPYAKKGIRWEAVGQAARLGIPDNLLDQYAGQPNINGHSVQADEITPIDQVGSGTMLIDVKVLHAMATRRPEWKYQLYPSELEKVRANGGNRDYAYDLFHVGVDPKSKRYLSEDFFFVEEARRLGFETYLVPNAVTGHIGSFEFIQNLPLLATTGLNVRNILKQTRPGA
jgi:hypothetical protein